MKMSVNSSVQMLVFIVILSVLSPACCLFSKFNLRGPSASVSTGKQLTQLIGLTEGMNRGLSTDNNKEIVSIIDEIAEKNEKAKPSDAQLSGNWQLLWTTEKETLFFAKNGLFGNKVSNIRQVIDIEGSSINNLIEFGDEKRFSVLGTTTRSDENAQRVNFRFSKAQLVLPPIDISLPPVGKGWFDNVFVSKDYRIARDIRGDYLITQRTP
jgi:hypothetical protein